MKLHEPDLVFFFCCETSAAIKRAYRKATYTLCSSRQITAKRCKHSPEIYLLKMSLIFIRRLGTDSTQEKGRALVY
ncbi:hypothetical protein HID58_056689 [Brassica napus]|uniref:Uncharacterized protein n=1 Tax=Brassica napus TaxID=3708 RepID=A0ABQ8AP16_BRANA|nr:hypothetical protein HID58_056689 [Brassica napus]